MNAPLIGARIERKEDYRFLTGAGQYTDDVTLPNQSYAVFVRSPHAHATINKVDKSKALKAPGVIAVFDGEDLKVGGLPCGWLITDVNGQPMKEPVHPSLAQGKVRHVGDQVAVVIAETLDQAHDAAELVEVDYGVLLESARLIVDDADFSAEMGDGRAWIAQGHLSRAQFNARIDALACEVITGQKPGRQAASERIVALIQGMAIGDVAFATHALREAERLGRGQLIELD